MVCVSISFYRQQTSWYMDTCTHVCMYNTYRMSPAYLVHTYVHCCTYNQVLGINITEAILISLYGVRYIISLSPGNLGSAPKLISHADICNIDFIFFYLILLCTSSFLTKGKAHLRLARDLTIPERPGRFRKNAIVFVGNHCPPRWV